MSTLISNIGSLVTNDPALGEGPLGLLADAAVVVDGDRVAWVGPGPAAPPAHDAVVAGGPARVPRVGDRPAPPGLAGARTP
ncbi:imidazolonepropionase, partial [Kitasatospora phosalacinea]